MVKEILDFKDIESDEDIAAFAIRINPDDGTDLYAKTKAILLSALVGLIYYEAPAEEQNMETLIMFINALEVRRYDSEYKSPVDIIFNELEIESHDHFAAKQYRKYKAVVGTAEEIMITELKIEFCSVRTPKGADPST